VPTLQLLSDLHLEFHRDSGRGFIESLDPEGVDVLVLAGDIHGASEIHDTLAWFCDLYPTVVFVAGNHEYYGSNPEEVYGILAKAQATLSGLVWLDSRTVEPVPGLKLAGATLWFPKPTGDEYLVRHARLNDFNYIEDMEPWVYEEHLRHKAFLRAIADKVDVVITHHIPTRHGIHEQYEGSPINHYFLYDLTETIEKTKPPLWLFGHTHAPMDFTVGETRLVCNSFGYPWEPKSQFREKLLIDVPREK